MLTQRFLYITVLTVFFIASTSSALAKGLQVSVAANHSHLVKLSQTASSIKVSNPKVADVIKHSSGNVSVVGNKIGRTTVRFLNNGHVFKQLNVSVIPDIPAIKHTLRNFLPEETIGVKAVNNSIALTGNISDGETAHKAVSLVKQYVSSTEGGSKVAVLNMMKIRTAQQVMLRVRVGEVQRTALKQLGFNLQGTRTTGNVTIPVSTGTGIGNPFGTFTSTSGVFGTAGVIYDSTNFDFSAMLDLLEQDGLIKLLAEPNLVAISGETANFLAGGEFPVPIAQEDDTISVEYKPFGVQVEFTPTVLSENRIRLSVEPEVSELSTAGAVSVASISIPSIATRRAKTTVELAPGESFMIAGLIKDGFSNTIKEIPGLGDIPILSSLIRSSSFSRDETELVIAVTPYLVDPVVSSDVRLPTDDLRTPSVLENFFLGALASNRGNSEDRTEGSDIEGQVGFIVN